MLSEHRGSGHTKARIGTDFPLGDVVMFVLKTLDLLECSPYMDNCSQTHLNPRWLILTLGVKEHGVSV